MGRAHDAGIVFIIVVVMVALAALAMLGYVIYYYLFAGWLAPTRRVMARVVRKQHRMKTIGGGADAGDALGFAIGDLADDGEDLSCDCFVTFEFDGRQQEFAVSMDVYTDIEEGDVGLLVHKGNLFRKFIKGAMGWSDPVRAPIQPV